jgi:lysozyme family protein
MLTLEAIFEDILAREAGFVNDPADKGGPTKFGITAATLGEWRSFGRPASAGEVASITPHEAKAIYQDRYVRKPGFEALIERPRTLAVLVDLSVHSGPGQATKTLQRALGVHVDGVFGPITLATALAQPDARLALRVCTSRLRFLGRLISQQLDDQDQDGVPDNTEFAAGWINRVAMLIEEIA